jgi:glycosyltransferase involved in cell wall biosynthesis
VAESATAASIAGLTVLVASGDAPQGALDRTLRSIAAQGVLSRHAVTVEPDRSLAEAVAAALRQHADRDIVCVQAGVELPFAWDARLAKAAHAAPEIAAAVPMCDASPLHALVDARNRELAAKDWTLIDRSAYCIGQRGYYETPALHPACAYLRGDALRALGELGRHEGHGDGAFLNRLARRWRDLGRLCVVCDYIYVTHPGAGMTGAAGVDETDFSAFTQHSPLGALRLAVNEGLVEGMPAVSMPALDAKPVQLHIMHFWGGGLDKWVRDFSNADIERTNLLLATYRIGESGGQRVVLYSDHQARLPVHTWDMARPLRSTAVASIEYRRILEQVIREFKVESIIISSLIGHSLEALRQPLRTVVVCHDFYPLCQAINPRFDDRCGACGESDLESCARVNPHYTTLGSPTVFEWRALRSAYVDLLLQRGIPMVVPSPSVSATLKRLEPRLGQTDMHVIPHGIDMQERKLPVPAVDAREPLRLVVLGGLAQNKGADLLKAAAPGLAGISRITLVGCGPRALALARECGWEAIERYDPADLPAILERIAPHAGILASVVPETFSYTLSELWAMGIVPIATNLGSFRDRIRDGIDGFLFEPTADALLGLLRSLRADPEPLARVGAEIHAFGRQRTTREMVRDYHAILPLEEREVARFDVDVGLETALTEPYRRLAQAYAHLQGAYEQLSKAYASANQAYVHANGEFTRVNAELARLRAHCDKYAKQLDSLDIGVRWWRGPEAERLVRELRSQIDAPRTPIPADANETKT